MFPQLWHGAAILLGKCKPPLSLFLEGLFPSLESTQKCLSGDASETLTVFLLSDMSLGKHRWGRISTLLMILEEQEAQQELTGCCHARSGILLPSLDSSSWLVTWITEPKSFVTCAAPPSPTLQSVSGSCGKCSPPRLPLCPSPESRLLRQ